MALPLTDAVLKEKAKSVGAVNGRLRRLIHHMQQTMHALKGVGLAAPQVGESIRLFVTGIRQGATGALVVVNPEVRRISVETEVAMEGCLSHPGKFLPVERAKFLEIEYVTPAGKVKTLKAAGFLARVIQHELDHLDGLTIEQTAQKQEEAPSAKDQS